MDVRRTQIAERIRLAEKRQREEHGFKLNRGVLSDERFAADSIGLGVMRAAEREHRIERTEAQRASLHVAAIGEIRGQDPTAAPCSVWTDPASVSLCSAHLRPSWRHAPAGESPATYGSRELVAHEIETFDLVGLGLHADRKTIDNAIGGLNFSGWLGPTTAGFGTSTCSSAIGSSPLRCRR